MATSAANIEFVPDAEPIDFVPDEAPAAVDFVPDEVVAQEAQRATQGAVQALDVMAAPRNLDWSDANEKMDLERFRESESLRAQAALNPAQAPTLLAKSREVRQQITPYSTIGQRLNLEALSEQQGRVEASATAARPSIPSDVVSSILGPGLSSTVQPIVESAGRNLGGATGGALGAALGTAATAGTGGLAPFVFGVGSAIMGSYAGAAGQEAILKTTETPEETIARQQRAAEDFERNPNLNRIGAMAAALPFFRPGLAQFGAAAAGDVGAARNLGIAGAIGGTLEAVGAKLQGREASPEDIAAAVFSNIIMNEPTRLGRRIGLLPSNEQLAMEEARAKYAELPREILINRADDTTNAPIEFIPEDVFAGVARAPGTRVAPIDAESGLATRPTTSTADVFERVQPKTGESNAQQISEPSAPDGGVRAPEIPPQDVPLPAPESGEGVQPSGQGRPLAETTPETPREVTPVEEATAARASEAPPELPGATSNKEAVVNAERAARELDPVIKEARISNAESIDRAQQVIQQNPLKPQEIITRLRENPQERTISLEDSAVLLVERTRLNNARQELLTRATDENLDPTARAAAKAEFDMVEGQLNALDQAAQDARSTWGRFGQLWQRSMREDYSLAALERRARLNKGEALTPEEATQVKTIADEVATEQAKADATIAEAETRQVEKGVDEAIAASAKQPELEPAVKSLADRIMAKLDSQAEAARKRLRERFKQLGSAPDPLILADFTVIAATRIAKSAIKASQWIAEMVKEFGEGARPYLQNAYDAANSKLDELVTQNTSDKKKRATVKSKILEPGQQQARVSAAIAERIKEGESLDNLGNYVDRLTDAFIAGGIRERQALVAAVKGVLEPLSPGITDRKVGELISGYGRATTLSKDPLKVIKRDLKGQLQQVSKLEALAAKEPLKKTGPERRTASDEERRLIKQVNEAKKAAGVVTTDPETQLKSTMDSARTRFANEIRDLTFEIETGKRPPERTPVEYDQDIQIMRGLRDRLKDTVRSLEGPQQLTEEQRIRVVTRGLQDSILALEQRIAGREPKARQAAPDTPEIRTLRAKRDALQAQMDEINAADSLLRENRKAEALVRSIEAAEAELASADQRPGRRQEPESQLVSEARAQLATLREQLRAKRDADPAVQQERMDRAEAAVEKSIKKLDEQLQAGDLSVQRAPTPAGSQRLEDLRMQRDAMIRLRNQLRAEARPKPNPLDVAIKARKSALKKQEADYEARIAAGDFAPRTRKPPLDLSSDPAAMDALARVQTVKDKFAKLQKDWELKNRTRTEKILGGIKQTWDAVRNLKLSMDLSAPLQTAFAMAAHPVEGVIAMGKGVRAFTEQFFKNSDTYAKRVEQEIANSPNNKNGLYKAMKLDLSEVTGAKREENAGSILERLADLETRWQDIPDFAKGLLGLKGEPLIRGIKSAAKVVPKVVGLGIKASNAGFGAIANHMRARTADAILARWYRRRGTPTKQQLELIGNQINAATGKGGLRGEEGIRALLFAPNYYLSILKQLSFQPAIKAGIKHEGGAAREILEEYVRAAATVTMIGVLQYLFGNRNKQTLDPRSANFGRAMTDKGTSLDVTMGRGAYVTLLGQIATGQRINRQGRVEKQDRTQAFLNFLKGRLSREISTALTTAAGTDFKGKPIDKVELAKELVSPLSWQDVDDVLKREGLTRGAFIQMLNLLGVTHRLAD